MADARTFLLPMLAGLLAGGSISFAVVSMARTTAAPAEASDQGAPETQPAERVATPVLTQGSTETAALGSLEQRMIALERSLASASTTEEEPPDPDAARAEIIASHAAAIDAHWQERSDASWAPRATDATHRDLEGIAVQAEVPFEIMDVDCRSTTCLAELEWSSYGAAVGGYPDLLHHAYALDCARRIVLPEPATSHDDRYRASLVIDCTGTR
jgi:hypothetical protein